MSYLMPMGSGEKDTPTPYVLSSATILCLFFIASVFFGLQGHKRAFNVNAGVFYLLLLVLLLGPSLFL
jgi:choline-glycine betaine transporter